MANDRKVNFLISANIEEFQDNLKTAQKRFRKFGYRMERTGRNLTQSITLPVAAIGGAAVKAATDFESSFADIRKTVNATEQQFGQISEEMREMSKTVPTSVNELNRIGGVAGQLGVEAENITQFTETIAMLGDTTDIAGEQAALSLSRFMNVMGTAQSDIDRLGSTVVGLGNNFAAMESEIVEIATSMAPLGNSIGLTEQQVLAFSTTIAASGGQAQAASTAFQKTANIMKQAVLSGSEELQVFAETAGMSASEFQESFEEDAAGALQSFLGGLKQVQDEGGSTAAVLDQLGLDDQRLIREFGKVIGNLDDLTKARAQANEEWYRNLALTEEAEKRYSTFGSRLEKFRNRLIDVGVTVGNMILPHLSDLMDSVEGVVEGFADMSEESQRSILEIAGLLAVGGPLMIGIGKLAKGIAAVIGGMKNMVKWSRTLAKAVGTLATALKVSTAALTGYVAAIAALGVASYKANQRSKNRVDAISDEVAHIGTAAEANRELIKTEQKMARVQQQITKGARGYGKTLEDLSQRRDELIAQRDKLAGEELVAQGLIDSTKKLQDFLSLEMSAEASVVGQVDLKGMSEVWGDLQGFLSMEFPSVIPNNDKVVTANPLTAMKQSDVDREIQRMDRVIAGWKKMEVEAVSSATAMGVVLTDVSHQFTSSFGQGMTNIVVQGEKVIDVLENIGKLLLSSAIQKGISLFLTGGLSGVSGFFGGGGGLLGAIGIPGMAQGGIVPSGFPNDTYPAMLSSGETVIPSPKPLPNMGGSQVIENVLVLDGKEIYRNQKRVHDKYNS